MKKSIINLLIIVYLFSFINLACYSAINTGSLSKIENELYGFDYSKDSNNSRIERLEESIYGKKSSGDLNKRFEKISKDTVAEQIGQEITPSEDSFEQDELVADNTVNYPILDEIEKKIFNQTYTNRDFHTRVVTIERKLFGKIYDVEDYSTRMDRIKAEVMPERLAREKVFGYDNSDNMNYGSNALKSSDLSGLNQNRFSTMPYGQENYIRPYANYGDYTGSASPIPQDIEEHLAQLEYDTFGTEFSNEDTTKRIKRLNSANKAKKSSHRYDSQKFNQRMSTVMEIGAMLLMILAMVL